MRTTHFIGLNAEAHQYTGIMRPVESDRHTHGMFDEEIPLRNWQASDGKLVKEVVQVVPWSSGPMIFTCLEIDGRRMCEWMEDSCLGNRQTDYVAGTFWV